jgi:pimeloyl-ACP methyl ester carboxylesterase
MAADVVQEGSLPGGLPYLALGDGPPLVILAGLSPENANPTGLARRFEVQILRPFAARTTVYSVNRRPGLATGTTMAEIAGHHAEALRRKFGEPVDVVGLSTGGSVAQQLAVDHPDVIRRLVLVGAGYRLGRLGKQLQLELAEHAAAGRNRRGNFALGKALGRNRASGLAVGALFWLVGSALVGRAKDPSDMVAVIMAEDAFDVGDRLAELRMPTLVIGGSDDQFYQANGERIIAETAERIPGARLVLYDGKGHAGTFMDKRLPRDVLAFVGEDRTG